MLPDIAAIIVAAGRGRRAGGDLPKQFRQIGGEMMLRRTLLMFLEARNVGAVLPVINREDADLYNEASAAIDGDRLLPPAFGGATRQASVRAGLEALSPRKPDYVLIHDAARPFASQDLVSRAITAVQKTGAAIPALPVTDTVKTIDGLGRVDKTLDRASL